MADIKWYPPRRCYRKSISVDGKEKVKYYYHPKTAKGKEAAFAEYLRDKDALTGMSFEDKVKKYLPLVLDWYQDHPPDDGAIIRHLRTMLETLELPPKQFVGSPDIEGYPYPLNYFAKNWGKQSWQLPEMFSHLLTAKPKSDTDDGSIGYWLNRYHRYCKTKAGLKPNSIQSRVRHIKPYEHFIDHTKKISGINNQSIRDFVKHLEDNKGLSETTCGTYFSAFVQFLTFLEIETDFTKPKELTLGQQRFTPNESTGDYRQRKKELLWSPEQFKKVKAALPKDQQLWILLCLNCGFRNTDIAHLRWKDVDLKNGRLFHQRQKLNKRKNAPTINYKLWPETIRLLKQRKKTHELVFLNSDGEPYCKEILIKGVPTEYDGIGNWWQKNKLNYDLPRLDFLRKTGTTFISKLNRAYKRMYLAETLQGVEDISYDYSDREVDEMFDSLTDEIGKAFLPRSTSH